MKDARPQAEELLEVLAALFDLVVITDRQGRVLHLSGGDLVGTEPSSFLPEGPFLESPSGPVELRSLDTECQGLPVRLWVGRRVSEPARAREAVQMADHRYRIVAENTYDWEFWIGPGGHFLYSSPSCERITGLPPAAFQRDPGLLDSLVHPEDRAAYASHRQAEMRGEGPLELEFRMCRPDGGQRWIHHACLPIRDRRGQFLGTRGSNRDVTARRRLEEERRRLSAAVEQCADAIVIADVQGVIRYVNPAFQRITGYAPGEVLGRRRGGELFGYLWSLPPGGEAWSHRATGYRKDGTPYEGAITISPVREAGGKVVHYVAILRDVSREAALEEQLRHAQKMEAVGALAGGLAHDFNNLLTGILGHAALLAAQSRPGDPVHEAASMIAETARRAAAITRSLLDFSRPGAGEQEAVDLHQVVAEVAGLLGHAVEHRIHLVQELRAPQAVIRGDPGQIHQVLMNLALNACDAMPEGGELVLRTDRVGDHLVLEVADTGEGIPEAIRERIFEPFFTTKEPGRGTGMGLAMVYSIVSGHGGRVEVDSEPGRGTVFRLLFPPAEGAAPREVRRDERPPARGTGRVLVVDDEEVVRQVTARMLRHLGYEVETAGGGAEGAERCRERRFDLVLLDQAMPGVDGAECLRRIRAADPEVRVLLTSGKEADPSLREGGVRGFLRKPFQLAELAAAVVEALG